MAEPAVRQARPLFRPHGAMAVQAPAHILPGLRLRDCHFSQVTMAGGAIDPGSDVTDVREVYKIGLDCHGYPGDLRITGSKLSQFLELGRVSPDIVHLLVTAPTFIGGGKTGLRAPIDARVTVPALYAVSHM